MKSLFTGILYGVEINDDTVLKTLLFADDQVLQPKKLIYRDHYILCTLQNTLGWKYLHLILK